MRIDSPQESVKYFEKGVAAEESVRIKAARSWFMKAVQLSSGKRHAYYLSRAASCEEQLGNLRQAMQLLRKAERSHPVGDLVQLLIASIQLDLKRPKLAERAVRKAIDIKPSSAAYIYLGYSMGRQNRFKEQQNSYEASVRLDPDNDEALYNLGVSHAFDGRLDEAEELFRRAIQIDSKYAIAHAELGHILIKKGSHREARRILRRSVRLDPDYYWSRMYLGLANWFLRRLKEAEDQYLEVVRIAPDDPYANCSLGDFLSAERRGDPELYLNKALSLSPNDEAALYYMGKHLHAENRDDEAVCYLRKAARKGHESAKELLAKLD